MRLPAPLRLVLGVVVVTLAVALVWWLVGYQIGKGMLSGPDALAFKKAFGFEEGAFLRLAFFALAGAVTVAAAGGAAGGAKWLPLAAVAFGASLLFPDKGIGATVGVFLFVLCASGLAEMGAGLRQVASAAVAGLVLGVAFTLEGPYGRSELAVIAALRGLFWFLPLLALPEYAERYVLRKRG